MIHVFSLEMNLLMFYKFKLNQILIWIIKLNLILIWIHKFNQTMSYQIKTYPHHQPTSAIKLVMYSIIDIYWNKTKNKIKNKKL